MASPTRLFSKTTYDATPDEVLCYTLIRLIGNEGHPALVARHAHALLITPTPDMDAMWCPHAAIIRELDASPDKTARVKIKASKLPSLSALDSWLDRYGQACNARIDRATGYLHLGYDALLVIAHTAREAINAGKFPGTKILARAEQDAKQFPDRPTPSSVKRKHHKKKPKAPPVTPETRALMREHLHMIMTDHRRYHDLTRGRARDFYARRAASPATFLTSQESAALEPHKDRDFKRLALRLTDAPDADLIAMALNAGFRMPDAYDLAPLHRALDYGHVEFCAKAITDAYSYEHPIRQRRTNRFVARLSPAEQQRRDNLIATLSAFVWPEDCGLRAQVYRAVAIEINESGKPWFSVSRIAARLGKKADGMTALHTSGIFDTVPTAPPICLQLSAYDVRYAYIRHYLGTSMMFSEDRPARFRYLLDDTARLFEYSVDNTPDLV